MPGSESSRVVWSLHVVRDHNSVPAEGGSVLVDPEGEVGKRYCIPAGGYALVRPDGYVGAPNRWRR